jgi:hypothetical protein
MSESYHAGRKLRDPVNGNEDVPATDTALNPGHYGISGASQPNDEIIDATDLLTVSCRGAIHVEGREKRIDVVTAAMGSQH